MDSVRRTTLRSPAQQRLLSSLVLLYIFQEKPQTNSADGIDRLLNLTGGRIFLRLFLTRNVLLEHFTRSNILGQLTFDQIETTAEGSSIPKLISTHGCDGSIDHDTAVGTVSDSDTSTPLPENDATLFQAKKIFHDIYPNGEEFLPRAPDPEDIIIEESVSADAS